MRKFILSVFLGCFSSSVFADADSAQLVINSIESRNSGYHALFLSGTVPNEGCSLSDRATILESDAGGKAMLRNL